MFALDVCSMFFLAVDLMILFLIDHVYWFTDPWLISCGHCFHSTYNSTTLYGSGTLVDFSCFLLFTLYLAGYLVVIPFFAGVGLLDFISLLQRLLDYSHSSTLWLVP